MPYGKVMSKYKHGTLHSGSKKGPKVTNRKQAIAIMYSEKRKGKKYDVHGSGKFSENDIKQGYRVCYDASDLDKLANQDEVTSGKMANRVKPKSRIGGY